MGSLVIGKSHGIHGMNYLLMEVLQWPLLVESTNAPNIISCSSPTKRELWSDILTTPVFNAHRRLICLILVFDDAPVTIQQIYDQMHRSKGAGMEIERIEKTSALLDYLSKHFNNPDHADTHILVNQHTEYHVHKMIMVQSPVFEAMLSKHWREGESQKIQLTEETDCMAYMETFLRYFYTGKVVINQNNLIPLLSLANKYQVVSLQSSLEQSVTKQMDINKVCEWYIYLRARQMTLADLAARLRNFICWNFDAAMRSPNSRQFDLALIKSFLKDPTLVVQNEFSLFQTILKWAEDVAHGNKEQEKSTILDLYLSIHYTFMSPEELSKAEEKLAPYVQGSCTSDKFRDILMSAYKYQTLPLARRQAMQMNYKPSRIYYTHCVIHADQLTKTSESTDKHQLYGNWSATMRMDPSHASVAAGDILPFLSAADPLVSVLPDSTPMQPANYGIKCYGQSWRQQQQQQLYQKYIIFELVPKSHGPSAICDAYAKAVSVVILLKPSGGQYVTEVITPAVVQRGNNQIVLGLDREDIEGAILCFTCLGSSILL